MAFVLLIIGACDCSGNDQQLTDVSCNTVLTENCDCLNGEEFTCGSTVGVCRQTTVVCKGGKWPKCIPLVRPGPEVCDGVDNDCDGDTDELSEVGSPRVCWSGPPTALFREGDPSSICERGMQECIFGSWTSCRGQVLPMTELCNGLDDDCDGRIDDDTYGRGLPCGPSSEVGICATGVTECVAADMVCVDNPATPNVIEPVNPQTESCNNLDDDCDGQVDEDVVRECSNDCGLGLERCAEGRWGACSAPMPQREDETTAPLTCDGIDNDCDGEIDEGCPCVHGEDEFCRENIVDAMGNPATCGIGIKTCVNGQWGECTFVGPVTERCNNWDDDCDGRIDGLTGVCGNQMLHGVGLCRTGTTTCEQGIWGDCIGSVDPVLEICDGQDQDCDGVADNGLNPNVKGDILFLIDISGSMCTYTSQIAAGIQGFLSSLQSTDHRLGIVAFPGPGANNPVQYVNTPPLVDATTFLNSLASLGCSGGGYEPGYNALLVVTSGSNQAINWRTDSKKIIIYITDEPAQTLSSMPVTEQMVAMQTVNCMLPGCMPGERVDIYIMTPNAYFSSYDEIVYQESDRLIDLNPVNSSRYEDEFENIFRDICRPAGP